MRVKVKGQLYFRLDDFKMDKENGSQTPTETFGYNFMACHK